MSSRETSLVGGHPQGFAATLRSDRWWVQPMLTVSVLGGFLVYATWAAFQGNHLADIDRIGWTNTIYPRQTFIIQAIAKRDRIKGIPFVHHIAAGGTLANRIDRGKPGAACKDECQAPA